MCSMAKEDVGEEEEKSNLLTSKSCTTTQAPAGR